MSCVLPSLSLRIMGHHRNPYVKLIRSEVEALVKETFGDDYMKLEEKKGRLIGIRSQIKAIQAEIARAQQVLKRLHEKRDRLLKEEKDHKVELGQHTHPARGMGKVRGGKRSFYDKSLFMWHDGSALIGMITHVDADQRQYCDEVKEVSITDERKKQVDDILTDAEKFCVR
jgi:hypothetical protein